MAEIASEKSARLADVAKAAKVSQATVSNVFNRPNLVREEVRDHVLAVAKAIGYRGPDPKGRLLRAGKVNAIGVATAEPLSYFFEDPYTRELMAGIADACDARGAGIALVSATNEEALAWNINSALVDGFVLICWEAGEHLVTLTRERRLPFVALGLGNPDRTISTIGIDNFQGARLAVKHLVELGHRRFAILAIAFVNDHVGRVGTWDIETATHMTSKERARGYFDALAEAGIVADGVPMYETQNGDAATVAVLESLFAGEPPTAILAMSDRIAIVAMDWLKARGLRVPEDVSVVGFDGIVEGAFAAPPLTTVVQPIGEIGRRAVGIVLDAKAGVLHDTLPTTLLVRGSTAPPRA